jgi:hypothetical protein
LKILSRIEKWASESADRTSLLTLLVCGGFATAVIAIVALIALIMLPRAALPF